MEIRDFLDALWRRKWLIVVTTVICIAVAVIGSFVVRPTYNASALIRVSSAPNPLIDRADVQYVSVLMNTYTIMARSWPLYQSVIDKLQLNLRPSQLNDMVEARVIADTEIIRITVSDSDPNRASDITNEIANMLISQTNSTSAGGQSASEAIKTLLDQIQTELVDLQTEYNRLLTTTPTDTAKIAETSRQSVIKQKTYETLLEQYDQTRLQETMRINAITLIEPATAPISPTSPRRNLNMALGAILGLLGGVGLVLLLNNMDRRVYTAHQAQSIFNLPVVAEIYNSHADNKQDFSELSQEQREAYRRLRVNILGLQSNAPMKTILVASAEANEGKSTIVANLALSFAQLNLRVLVIDFNMRDPMQDTLFDLKNEKGLSGVLQKRITATEALQQTRSKNLKVMTSGKIPEDPAGLLSSPQVEQMLHELEPKFDIILMDTPGLLAVVDAAVIAPLADGVVHVVRCGQSRSDAIKMTLAQITEVQGRQVGLIVNDAPNRKSIAYRILQSA